MRLSYNPLSLSSRHASLSGCRFAPLAFFLLMFALCSHAQSNVKITHPVAAQVIFGNYDPADYAPPKPNPLPSELALELAARISPDSLKNYIVRLSQFGTRNTGSDTTSNTTGIGAARRWVHQKFEEFGAASQGRLLPTYFQFDQVICSAGQHRNILAVLPGTDTAQHGIVLVEGHMDSRCDVLCDITCPAEGVEDNATGTALVMELARVMSRYSFPNTLVFMVTIGEEQSLAGARAFATYARNNNLPIRATLNNDVIGGIYCGKTSSPPSCPGLDNVDSTSVRLFSSGGFNSTHKQLARFIKLQYRENLLPTAAVPMNVRIMSPEDRTGRGGDHIPFREKSYPAMRFTSANEHGDASNGPTYTDRQHTSDDVLGADTDGDGTVDSFFVDFNYLSRNAAINANAMAMAALAVPTPINFTASRAFNILNVNIIGTSGSSAYRVALRTMTNDWDTVYTLRPAPAPSDTLYCKPTGTLYVSIATVDNFGVESLFSVEKLIAASSTDEPNETAAPNIRLFQNRPNPFDEATWISFWVNDPPIHREAHIHVTDLQGKTVERIPVALRQGMNEVLYTHGYGVRGTFAYALLIDGHTVDARQMVFAN